MQQYTFTPAQYDADPLACYHKACNFVEHVEKESGATFVYEVVKDLCEGGATHVEIGWYGYHANDVSDQNNSVWFTVPITAFGSTKALEALATQLAAIGPLVQEF